jgi:asparagine N-glycosylation enzyme membrane subunit Stt3
MVMITIAILLGVILVGKRKEPAYGFVLAWASYGIYAAQLKQAVYVGYIAALSVCILLALTLTILIRTPKQAE